LASLPFLAISSFDAGFCGVGATLSICRRSGSDELYISYEWGMRYGGMDVPWPYEGVRKRALAAGDGAGTMGVVR